jgi:hypothetical protein
MLARQNICIRGHLEEDSNFIEMLSLFWQKKTQFCVTTLKTHLVFPRYTSPDIQNEILHFAAKQIQNNPKAAYVYCRPHVLNLCIVHASKIPLVRNIMDTMQKVTLAFKYSSKRLLAFKEQLGDNPIARDEMGRRSKLKVLFETRWASRADCLSVFVDAFKVNNILIDS